MTHSAQSANTRDFYLPTSVFDGISFDEVLAKIGGTATGVKSKVTNHVVVSLPAGFDIIASLESPHQKLLVNDQGLPLAKVFDTPPSEGSNGSMQLVSDDEAARIAQLLAAAPVFKPAVAPKFMQTFYLPSKVLNGGTFDDVLTALGLTQTGQTTEHTNSVEVTGSEFYGFENGDYPLHSWLVNSDGVRMLRVVHQPGSGNPMKSFVELLKH